MTDASSLVTVIEQTQPDEIYNLAAQSHVAVSFEEPEYTANSDALGTLRILEAIRILGMENRTRFYQASTSELYGLVQETPQTETTPFYPAITLWRRQALRVLDHGQLPRSLRACSPATASCSTTSRRCAARSFVTRKITRGLARIKLGLQERLYLGNLDAKRDWGHARDYVEAQWLMLQQPAAEDYVIATGIQYSVREFVDRSARELGMRLVWRGGGIDEKAYDESGRCIVAVDPRYFRPADVETLLGDASKARKKLGWTPRTTFDKLVAEMTQADLRQAQDAQLLLDRRK